MYVACRQLKVELPREAGKSGPPPFKIFEKGDQVPEALTWPYHILISHLNLEWLKWDGDSEKNAPHNAHKGGAVIIPSIFKKMRPNLTEAERIEIAQQESEEYTARGLVQRQDEITSIEKKKIPAEPLACADCPGKAFKNKSGLLSHLRAKHPKEGLSPKAG